MQYMLAKGGWSVSSLEEDCRTSLPRHFVFQSELKILDLARHGGAEFNLAGRQAIEHGIGMGRGSVWLGLTGSCRVSCADDRPTPRLPR